ncbi:hypothetical protein SPBR_00065 [Sporothrix brasiliensis 5110]|uniref:PARP catalytic domain-containing protein n=1 Tax=Sporothrix brasiliensis 5110 TaxID=1398154 RepID=A0A0C2ITA6_9PEZI|nr:uncharacterized protein SPBR_00065 [Sporothrix brasiliensis 5110]KIH90070.1 hypothetical protein SPBR_00065 [Sporothrix brasiliensis 5110]
MPIITISKSSALRAAWHKELLASNLSAQLDDGSLIEFPPALLQLTRDYLNRKRLVANSDERNRHIDELIRDHVQNEHGDPEVAILACTLEYSPFTAIAALKSLRGDNQENPSYTRYLRCLVVASSIAPRYVSIPEAQVAQYLLQIRLGYADPLQIFHNMIATLSTIPNSQMLPAEYINRLLAFCQIPQSYQLYLHMLQNQCRFASLYRSVSWVHEYLSNQQCQLAREVLEGQIPDLQLWASWKPDEAMLQKWETYNFTPQHLARLRPIFHLEGPDLTRTGNPTFKDCGPACFQTVAVEPADVALIQRLQQLLLQAMEIGPEAISLLSRLCIESTATDNSLTFAETIIRIADPECCTAAIVLVNSLTPTASVSARMMTLSSTLLTLQRHPALREVFASRIIDIVVPTMEAAQESYKTHLFGSTNDTLSYKIQAYGRAIRYAPWLNEFVSAEFLAGLDRFPPEDVFQGIMSRLQVPQSESVEKALKDYLLATLGGTGTEEEIASLKVAVDGEQEFWITHQDVERNRILGIIRKLAYMKDMEFLHACRLQILVEDVVLLRDLLGLIERDSHVSCIDMLRILARRIELPMVVHDVWISLMMLMLNQRADDLLVWSCDNLTVQDWFRFVTDMRVVFNGRPDQMAALANLGMSLQRLTWWQQLQTEYLVGVEYLDRLQRRQNGGIASMKWLYLQEIPNVTALLSTIVGRKTLGYDPQWILSFFDSSPSSITTLCSCLAAHDESSPQGLYGIRTILERFYMHEGWPDSATQAYMLAWRRSKDLTEGDKNAITLLAELMGIKPSLNPHGLNVIKNKMLREYDRVIELAREVEGLRLQLDRKDSTRTNSLAKRIGMQGTRPYIDPDIPEALSDAIECVGTKEYELCFPLAHLQGHDRKVRGIGSDLFPILTVRVILNGVERTHGFCVHLVPHETVHEPGKGLQVQLKQQMNHTYWRPKSNAHRKPTSRLCTASFNLFTHALAQRLHRHFLLGGVTLKSVYDLTNETIRRPGSQCTACGDELTGLWKPTICTKDGCIKEMSQSGLLVRAYGLLIDAPVLDFLLCCLYAAAKDNSGLQLLSTDCPYEKSRLITILDSFPRLQADDTMTPFDLLNKIRLGNYLSHEREQVLAWMSKWFRGCMLSAPQGKRLSIMSDVDQFLLYNSTPECEKAFESYNTNSASSGSARLAPLPRTGDVVFHGSQTSRMWKVLTEGLRNMSNTRYMAHGAVNGPGIYLADEPSTSFSYSGTLNNTWSKSAFSNKKILLGCELIKDDPLATLPPGTKKPPAGTHIVTDESRVLVRYVFICPSGYSMPPVRHIETGMRSTFASLRSGAAL